MNQARRHIPGFPGYFATEKGEILSLHRKTTRILSRSITKGYAKVKLYLNGTHYNQHVHRLVALAFHGPMPPGTECAHGNGDRLDNRPENLRWATRWENMKDRDAHGTMVRGTRSGNAKLTEADVIEIRRLRGVMTVREIATSFGVSQGVVWGIQVRRRWKHVL